MIDFLQFWVFTLGAPVAAVLAIAHAVRGDYRLGVIVSLQMCLSMWQGLARTAKKIIINLTAMIMHLTFT